MDMRRKTNKKHPPASASSNGNLIISAPLGDFRHMAHIGRDGADFGKEHLFTLQRDRKGASQAAQSYYSNQHESPIIKSSIPVHKAMEAMKQQNAQLQGLPYTSSINTSDSLSDLEVLGITSAAGYKPYASDDHGSHPGYRHQGTYRQYSSNDHDEMGSSHPSDDDLPPHLQRSREQDDGDTTSLLNDVLAVMELPRYCSLPGNAAAPTRSTGDSLATCSKKEYQNSSDGINSTRSISSSSKHDGMMVTGSETDSRGEYAARNRLREQSGPLERIETIEEVEVLQSCEIQALAPQPVYHSRHRSESSRYRDADTDSDWREIEARHDLEPAEIDPRIAAQYKDEPVFGASSLPRSTGVTRPIMLAEDVVYDDEIAL